MSIANQLNIVHWTLKHQEALKLHQTYPGTANFSGLGSGKHIPAIQALKIWEQDGPALILAPSVIFNNWIKQIPIYAPNVSIGEVGTNYKTMPHVYLLSYEKLSRSEWQGLSATQLFNLPQFATVICDEAHRIRNPETKTAQACYRFGDAAQHRIALTGTPFMNRSTDIYGIMRFVDSSLFGTDYQAFLRKYLPVTSSNLDELHQLTYSRAIK